MIRQKIFGVLMIVLGWIGSAVEGDYSILVFMGFIGIILLTAKKRIME